MWIEIDAANSNFYAPKFDEKVEFSSTGKAQVSKEVGEYLIEEYDAITATSKKENTKKESKEVTYNG